MASCAARTTLTMGFLVQLAESGSFTLHTLSAFTVLTFFGEHSSASSSSSAISIRSGFWPGQQGEDNIIYAKDCCIQNTGANTVAMASWWEQGLWRLLLWKSSSGTSLRSAKQMCLEICRLLLNLRWHFLHSRPVPSSVCCGLSGDSDSTSDMSFFGWLDNLLGLCRSAWAFLVDPFGLPLFLLMLSTTM